MADPRPIHQAVGAAAVPATEQLTVPDHIARDVEQAESTDRWNEGVPFKSRWERKLYESGFAAGWDRARVLVPASTSAPAKPGPNRRQDEARYRFLRDCTGDEWQQITDAMRVFGKNLDEAVADLMANQEPTHG